MTERPKDNGADRAVKWTEKQCHALVPGPHPDVPGCCDAPGWCWILWGEAMSGRYKFPGDEKEVETPKEKSVAEMRKSAHFRDFIHLLALLAFSYFAVFAFVGLTWFLMGWKS
jgi:hypothetical protein